MRWRYLLLSCRLGNKFNCCILFAFWSIIIFWEIWMFDSSTFFLLWNRVTGPFFCLLLSMFWEKVKYNCEYLCQRVILYTNIYIYFNPGVAISCAYYLTIHYRATKQFFSKTIPWVSPKHQVVTMWHRWPGISAYNKNNCNIHVQPETILKASMCVRAHLELPGHQGWLKCF